MARTLRKARRSTYKRKYVRVRKKTIVQAAVTGLGLAGAFGAGYLAKRGRPTTRRSRARYKQPTLPGFKNPRKGFFHP